LHIAAGGAPGLDSLVADIAQEFGMTDAPTSFVMDDNNMDWNSLYPFSSVPHLILFTSLWTDIHTMAVFVSVQS
jgi:hypothetical protein